MENTRRDRVLEIFFRGLRGEDLCVQKLADEYEGKVKVGKVNVDEQPELAAAFRVASIPTVVLFKDGEIAEDSTEVFSYFVCCVCPVKPLKAGLCYRPSDSAIKAIGEHTMIGKPEIGFMFPCFDDRATNIYNALYYTKDIANVHPSFIKTISSS